MILATIHLDKFAIIASDKKEVFIANGIIFSRHENAEKTIHTGIGLITGAGYLKLLSCILREIGEQLHDFS